MLLLSDQNEEKFQRNAFPVKSHEHLQWIFTLWLNTAMKNIIQFDMWKPIFTSPGLAFASIIG